MKVAKAKKKKIQLNKCERETEKKVFSFLWLPVYIYQCSLKYVFISAVLLNGS